MTERELRRLSRTDLLELLLTQRKENEQLRCILDETQAQLADRTIKIDQAGSIAEASLQLSGIFNAAQDSCQHYIENSKLLSERQSKVCQQMEEETKEKCDRMVAEAELKAQQCWENCSAYSPLPIFGQAAPILTICSTSYRKSFSPPFWLSCWVLL